MSEPLCCDGSPAGSSRQVRTWFLLVTLVFLSGLLVIHSSAFVLDSVIFTIRENGNADATVSYQLEGILENSIPDSIIESELEKGLTTDPANPPVLESFSRSRIVLLMPEFATVRTTADGTEYVTTPLNFTRAETALQQSALNYLVRADFTPATVEIQFPDKYTETLHDVDQLPWVSHLIPAATKPATVQPTPTHPAAMATVFTTAPPATGGSEEKISKRTPAAEATEAVPITPLLPLAAAGAAGLFFVRRRI